MFIHPDEYIIIMEDDFYNPFNDDDIKMIVDAGIKTVHVPHSIYWDKIYQPNTSERNWSSLDKTIEKYLKTDLKLTLPFYYTMPRWFHPSLYLDNTKQNPDEVIPNYANQDFGFAVDEFAKEVLHHLFDLRNRIQLTYAIPSLGEFLYGGITPDPYKIPEEFIHKFVIDRQKILKKQHNEIWLYYHNFLNGPRNWNATRLPFLYEALRNRFKKTPIYSVQFAHFAVGNVLTSSECQYLVKKYHEIYGINFFIGSQYCDGLSNNFNEAMRQNVRGFLTCPVMSFTEMNGHMQPWMIEAIKEANKKFKEKYHDTY